jgi:homeobox protein cut-like
VQESLQAGINHSMDTSQASLRALVESVKEFKRASDEDKAKGLDIILKIFQDEVTVLSRRAKTAERAFLQVFAAMAEAPDPVLPLTHTRDTLRAFARLQEEHDKLKGEAADTKIALAASSDMAAENAKLQSEVHLLEAELQKLQNQDITIRELEQRVNDFENLVEEQVGERLAARESELRRLFEAELEAVREAETAAEARVMSLKCSLADAVAARDEAQAALYSAKATTPSDNPSDGFARQNVEFEALSNEYERLVAKNASMAAEISVLKQHLNSNISQGGSPMHDTRMDPLSSLRLQADVHRHRAEDAEEKVSKLRAELALVQQDFTRWQDCANDRQASLEHALAEACGNLKSKEGEVQTLVADLQSRPTCAELQLVRHQLSLVQAVVFNSASESHVNPSEPNADALSASSGGTGDVDLHAILVKRIRQLESNALRAEERNTAGQSEISDLHARLAASQQEVQQLQQLIDRLEAALESHSSGKLPMLDVQSPSSLTAETQLSALFPGRAPASSHEEISSSAQEPTHMVDVFKSQRDRFRSRMVTLENELQQRTSQLAGSYGKVQQLTQDNVKLYGKIRYLQSFLASHFKGAPERAIDNVRVRASGADEDFEKAYKKLYNEANDPFGDFSRYGLVQRTVTHPRPAPSCLHNSTGKKERSNTRD